MVRMCCVCRKVENKGDWQVQPAVVTGKVSHVYCPPCYEDLMDEIDRYAMQNLTRSVYTVIHAGLATGV